MRSLFVRPIQLLTLVFVLSLLLALGTLALFTSLDFARIRSVRSHVNRTALLQDSQVLLKDAQQQLLSRNLDVAAQLAGVRRDLSLIPVRGAPIGPVTKERLLQLDQLLGRAQADPRAGVNLALPVIQQMLDREISIQDGLLDEVHDRIELEQRVAWVAAIGIPILLLVVLWALRERVFRPIGNLKDFLSRLSEGDFAPLSLRKIDPLLLPLFDNYNRMVTRLEQLELANRTRTLSLQQEVHAATHTLLKQQQSLARAERLAAVGEVSAAVAHELRNPIAGIQVTLANLRAELKDAELGERVDLVIAELERVTRLLKGLLQQSSHVPEPRRMVEVGNLVHDLATLVRYQLPAQIRLEVDARGGLRCFLPEDGVRQALLNIILNAVEAMRSSPGTIRVEVEHQASNVTLRVLDEGPGFGDEMLAGGARPFVTSRETGTGLGLAIVMRFARDLGGELSVANRSPRGARVTLILPCNERNSAADRG